MSLTPELETLGRKLVLKFHMGADLDDVTEISDALPPDSRSTFPGSMLQMTSAANEVLHKRATREQTLESFTQEGHSHDEAQALFALAYDTLSKHTARSAASDGAVAAKQNPLLASQIAAMAHRQTLILSRLGQCEKLLGIVLPLAMWGVMMLAFDLRWWVALVCGVGAALFVMLAGFFIGGIVTSRFAKQFLQRWPRREADYGVAIAILDCLDGVPMKDETVAKIKKEEIDRINRTLRSRSRRRR